MPHENKRLPVLHPKPSLLQHQKKPLSTSNPKFSSQYFCCIFCWPTSQPPSAAIEIKHRLLPLFRLADHLLGTLAGLSSTRVSRRSCWEKKVEFISVVDFIQMNGSTNYKLCWHDVSGENHKTPDSNEVDDSIISIFQIFEIQAKELAKHCRVNINQPSSIHPSHPQPPCVHSLGVPTIQSDTDGKFRFLDALHKV